MGNSLQIEDLFKNVMSKWPTMNIASIITLVAVPADNYH